MELFSILKASFTWKHRAFNGTPTHWFLVSIPPSDEAKRNKKMWNGIPGYVQFRNGFYFNSFEKDVFQHLAFLVSLSPVFVMFLS